MLDQDKQDEITSFIKTMLMNTIVQIADEVGNIKKSIAPASPTEPATPDAIASTSDPVTVGYAAPVEIRAKEVSLLGLDSKAPAPIQWFSRFMIWQHPDPKERKEAVNTFVRRTMQIVGLVTGLLVLHLTASMSAMEAKLANVTDRQGVTTVTTPSLDASAPIVDAGTDLE